MAQGIDRGVRQGALLAGFPVLYLAALRAGYGFYLTPESVSALWPASGVGLFAFYVARIRIWPLLLLIAIGCDHLAAWMQAPGEAVGFASYSQVEFLLGAWLLRRVCPRGCDVAAVGDLLRFVAVGVVLAPAISALLGAWRFVTIQPGLDYLSVWQVWWSSDALGVLVFAPLLLAWRTWPRGGETGCGWGETLAALAVLAGLSALVFWRDAQPFGSLLHSPYLVFPALAWLAFRASTRVVVGGIALVALVVVGAASVGKGPFLRLSGETIQAHVLGIQVFLLVTAASFLLLHAALSDRRQAAEERLRASLQVERADTISSLSAGLAHDLNNDLTTILGGLHLVIDEESAQERERIVEGTYGSARRTSLLAHRLVQLGRGGAPDLRPLEVDTYLADLAPVLRTALGAGHRLAHEGHSSRRVRIDPVEMDRVFINLAANAREAMEEGGTLTLTVRDDGSEVVIRVWDTGPGVPPDLVDRLFEPFVSSKARGSGIGLASARSIVEDAGGRIRWVPSDAGGATFEIRLPAEAP